MAVTRHLLALLLLAPLACGCVAGSAGNGGDTTNLGNCQTDYWNITNDGSHGVVHGFVGVNCPTLPRSWHAWITLQWATGKRSAERVWENQGEPHQANDVPSPDETYHVEAFCTPGRWRVVISVNGLNHAGHYRSNTVHGTVSNGGARRITNCSRDY